MTKFKKISNFLIRSKVAENYFFMTFLQGATLLIGLLIYPYLICTLGKEAYGTYVFIFSNIQFFFIFISFGFSMPALKKISLFQDDNEVKSRTVSEVFTAKICMYLLCSIVLVLLVAFIPFVRANMILYIIIFTVPLENILFPTWYFQGIQKMKFVTHVNLTLRILTIPLIFFFVKSPADLLKYTLIVTLLPIVGSVFVFFYLQIKEKIKIRFVSLVSLRSVFRDALPFSWTSIFHAVKKELVTFIVGIFFSMENVAIYDLANKIINIPRLITSSINLALFPKVVKNFTSERVKQIIKYETIIGLAIILLIVVLGYWVVLILGGRNMLDAYPIAVILSFTVYAWLILGCYVDYEKIKTEQTNLEIEENQFVAIVSFVLFVFVGLLICKNVLVLALAYSLSHLVEIIYCRYLIKKHKLL